MPRLTLTERSKATTKPWFSRLLRHPVLVYSGTQTHTCLLTYLFTYLLASDPHGAVS